MIWPQLAARRLFDYGRRSTPLQTVAPKGAGAQRSERRTRPLPGLCAIQAGRTFNRDRYGTSDYWITSSARTKSEVGIVMLSALAVLRLMTSSNFVACKTGISAGLAPLRILPV